MSADRFADATRLLDEGVGSAYPGAVLAVLWQGDVAVRHAAGRMAARDDAGPATPRTIYDLASLTKVVATLPLVLQAIGESRLALDDPVAAHLPECPHGNVTIRHLLTHTSGLPAWVPFYLDASGADAIVRRAAATPLIADPGTAVTYSDLGFILLGAVAQHALGGPLDVLARTRLYEPLGMANTGYLPSPAARDAIAPTEDGTAIEQDMAGEAGRRHTWRRYLIWGEAHDSTAHAMGGVSGHAGAFGTADDLLAYARMWLADGRGPRGRVLERALVRDAIRPHTPPPGLRGLGWALSGEHGWWGHALSNRAFGHTGFTGTAMVIDPARDLAIVLLSNAVHLGRDRTGILTLRPRIAEVVAAAVA